MSCRHAVRIGTVISRAQVHLGLVGNASHSLFVSKTRISLLSVAKGSTFVALHSKAIFSRTSNTGGNRTAGMGRLHR